MESGGMLNNMSQRSVLIGVIGGESPPDEAKAIAEKVGELIARKGGILICGGRGGVMEYACKGARNAGGLTIGILPTMSKEDANPYVAIPIVTAMSTARNAILVRSSDALIAIDGSYGTLTEIAYALDFKKKVVLLNSWRVDKIGADRNLLVMASTPEEAVGFAFREAALEERDKKP
jgi:hypothetical protein